MPPFLLGVSLSLQDRALGGAYTFAHRKRPAFSFFGHSLVRRISNSPRGRSHVPVRLFLQSSISSSWIPLHPAGIGVSMRAASARDVYFFSKKVEGTQQNVRGWTVYYRKTKMIETVETSIIYGPFEYET